MHAGLVCSKLALYGYTWSVFPTAHANFTVDGAVVSLPTNEFAPATIIVLKILDYAFVVVGVAIPFGKTLQVLFCSRNHLEKVRVEFSTEFAHAPERLQSKSARHDASE